MRKNKKNLGKFISLEFKDSFVIYFFTVAYNTKMHEIKFIENNFGTSIL